MIIFSNFKRSAAAASKLEEAGYENIACVTSGLQSVKPGLVPFSGFIFRGRIVNMDLLVCCVFRDI